MIGILVTFGLMFSIFSSFDCKYVRVDVGFKPDNTIYRSGEFGLGLWTMEDPTTPGKCLTIDISRTLGSITQGDHYYSSSFLNGDVIWGAARITALSGLFFGLVDAVIIYTLILSIDNSRHSRKEVIICLSLLPFLCEGVKFGLFFNTEPCTSQLWEQKNTVGDSMVEWVDQFEADQCYMDRSTYASLGAIVCYLLLIICLTVSLVMPDYTHQLIRDQRLGTGLDFDDVSMPSYLGSIGLSEASLSTRHTGGSLISRNTADSGKSCKSSSTNNSVNQMASIIEEGSSASYKSVSSMKSSPDSKSSMYEISANSSDDSSDDSSGEYRDYYR